jgi:hypothetical protein
MDGWIWLSCGTLILASVIVGFAQWKSFNNNMNNSTLFSCYVAIVLVGVLVGMLLNSWVPVLIVGILSLVLLSVYGAMNNIPTWYWVLFLSTSMIAVIFAFLFFETSNSKKEKECKVCKRVSDSPPILMEPVKVISMEPVKEAILLAPSENPHLVEGTRSQPFQPLVGIAGTNNYSDSLYKSLHGSGHRPALNMPDYNVKPLVIPPLILPNTPTRSIFDNPNTTIEQDVVLEHKRSSRRKSFKK